MAAITIANPLASQPTLEALPLSLVEERDLLAERACAAAKVVTSPDAFDAGNVIFRAIQKLLSSVEKRRKELKAPLLDLGKQLDAAAADAMKPLEAAKEVLGQALLVFERAENARREEERRRAEAEAEERQRQAEIAAEEERQRLQQEAAAETPPWEAPPEIPATAALPERIPVAHTPAPLKSAAKVTVSRDVVIDPALLPREISGTPLWIPDHATIKRLALAGMKIPGVTVVESTGIGAKGSR